MVECYPMSAHDPVFEECLAFVLSVEGGYFDDGPGGDTGGPTNHGVTQATYDLYRRLFSLPSQPVRQITPAEVREVYWTLYWNRARCSVLAPPLALCVFDAAVHHGPKKAVTMLQECVGAVPDGILGLKTFHLVYDEDLVSLIDRYLSLRYHVLLDISRRPGQAQFRKGWTNRIRRLKAQALVMLHRPQAKE